MMSINVKGKYVFRQEDKVIYSGENIITFLGESFFINRCINDDLNPIKYIVLGNGETVPLKSDENLGNELYRRTCIREADLTNKCIRLTSSFNASEVIGITEIGVCNDTILISHDVFKEITSTMLVNPIGSVEIEYTFQFITSTIREGWSKVEGSVNTYRIYEPSNVIGVYEEDTNNGYKKVTSKEVVLSTEGSYYYDSILQNLYVNTYNNRNPSDINLIIQTK